MSASLSLPHGMSSSTHARQQGMMMEQHDQVAPRPLSYPHSQEVRIVKL